MYQSPHPTLPPRRPEYPRHTLARVGAKKGALIGFAASVGYGLAMFLVIGLTSDFPSPLGIIKLLLFAFLPICVLAGLPCAGLGALSGWMIGRMLQRTHHPLSAQGALLSGLKVALIVSAVLNIGLFWLPFGPFWNYLMLLGGPSLIYLVVAAFSAYRLNARAASSPA